VNIVAGDSVSFDGVGSDQISSGALSSVEQTGIGDGGNINIITRELFIINGALLSARSGGQGNAGNLYVTANSVLLDNQGQLLAETASGEGGNIKLQVEDLLSMRNNSLISAQAFNNGNGGNIDMNARLIVAVPAENSDIVADAQQGKGGNINITTSGIFGLEFRDQRTNESDITASSEIGLDGEVTINQLDVDPSQGLAALPANFVDASSQIDQSCSVAGSQQENRFVITGTGGLPPRPDDPRVLAFPTVPVRSLPQGEAGGDKEGEEDSSVFSPPSPSSGSSSPAPLVEASGWVYGAKGEVILVAQVPTSTRYGSWSKPPTCQRR
jgi:large exoprotein involved in heme utilization and adhesion